MAAKMFVVLLIQKLLLKNYLFKKKKAVNQVSYVLSKVRVHVQHSLF